MAKAAGYRGETVVTSTGVKALPSDPNAWQNPNNVERYVRNIAAGLAKVDASGTAHYTPMPMPM